jgi:hypothetical protein
VIAVPVVKVVIVIVDLVAMAAVVLAVALVAMVAVIAVPAPRAGAKEVIQIICQLSCPTIDCQADCKTKKGSGSLRGPFFFSRTIQDQLEVNRSQLYTVSAPGL